MELTPKQKKKIEVIEFKSSKLGFLCKIRVVYMAKKEVMNKAKVANGFVGYIKQFAALDLNNLKPDLKMTGTKVSYFNKGPRLIRKKNNITNNYMNRDDWAGRAPFLLNTEELATLWHFPMEATANAPLIQKTPAKKYKPPANLVSEDSSSNLNIIKEELLAGDFSKKRVDSSQSQRESIKETSEEEAIKKEFEQEISNNSNTKGSPPANLPFG